MIVRRMRAALTCPFCRDALAGETYACARDGCGARYHEACWTELGRDHGGCAVPSCGSQAARPEAAGRRTWRRLRLAAAAALLPRAVVRMVREERGAFAYAREVASRYLAVRRVLPGLRDRHGGPVTGPVIDAHPLAVVGLFLLGLPLFVAAVLLPFVLTLVLADALHLRGERVYYVGFGLSAAAAFLVGTRLPALAAFPLALLCWTLRGVARILRDEVAALGRADDLVAPRVVRSSGRKGKGDDVRG